MSERRAALVVLLPSTALAVALAAILPRPPGPVPPALYFPTTPGVVLTYSDGTTYTVTSAAPGDVPGSYLVWITTPAGPMAIAVAPGSVAVVAFKGAILHHPHFWLDPTGRRRDRHGTIRVAGVESVTVPAGTFEAVRVDWDRANHGSDWFAPGVGLVKSESALGGRVLTAATGVSRR